MEYLLTFLVNILKIASPSGFTRNAMNFIKSTLMELGFKETSFVVGFTKSELFGNQYFLTPKGNLIVELAGKNKTKTIGITAHTDTLGAKITKINDNGTFLFSCIGDLMLPTLESHYCTVHTREGKTFKGTIQCKESPLHLFKHTGRELVRKEENMILELDYQVENKKEVQDLGIIQGDYISLDPNTVVDYNSKVIKSRFLDNKSGVAIIMSVLNSIYSLNTQPLYDTYIIINSYEELAHPTNFIPQITEMVAIDAILVGDDLDTDIKSTHITTNDTLGSYDYDLVNHLIGLAKQENIIHKYGYMKNYGSDVSLGHRSHLDVKAGLIGPGVKWMHSVEKTSFVALEETAKLLWAYLTIPETS